MNESYISALFNDEEELLSSIKTIRKAGIKIRDVFSPFPVHGIDNALGIKPSRIPIVGFIAGAIGTVFAFLFQAWVFVVAWPLNIGGKPFFAVPSFIPVTFEVTVLFAAFGMIGAFLYKSKLFPGSKNKIYSERITDDSFVMIIEQDEDMTEDKKREIEKHLYDGGAFDVDFVDINKSVNS
jgi:hypothetical protein